MYFDDNFVPKHAGKIKNGRVVSKWGKSGHLYAHDIWEIPISYGTNVKYYQVISDKEIVECFVEYAKSKDVVIP